MNVKVEIELCCLPRAEDKEQMHFAAKNLTNDINSIVITEPQRKENTLIAEFTIHNARQVDVVDKIGKGFTHVLENYSDSSISFPKRRTTVRKLGGGQRVL
ncbi:MAG: hypothetical protein AAGD25_41280 [Cyanobacteria bacterium P01_F01_bin.150]